MSNRPRILAALAAVALALGAALAVGSAASAHDQVISTDPAEGEVLAVAPSQISMRFTAELIQMGAIVFVVDGSERDWAAGEPTVDGSELVQPLESGMPDGSYQVRWQVVSADGHPISGFFDFAVGAPTGPITPPGVADDTDSSRSNEQPAAASPPCSGSASSAPQSAWRSSPPSSRCDPVGARSRRRIEQHQQ